MSLTAQQAFDKIRSDKALSKEFVSDPQGTLKKLGLDTSKLTIKPSSGKNSATLTYGSGPDGELSESELESVAGGKGGSNVCGSVGCVACASVG